MKNDFSKEITDGYIHIFLSNKDKKIGELILEYWPDENYLHIIYVEVEKLNRNKGYFKKLIVKGIEEAKNLGCLGLESRTVDLSIDGKFAVNSFPHKIETRKYTGKFFIFD